MNEDSIGLGMIEQEIGQTKCETRLMEIADSNILSYIKKFLLQTNID